MPVTASRLGSSPITIDWSNLSGKGAIEPDREKLAEAWERLKTLFQKKEVGFFDSPADPRISQVAESQALADEILKEGKFTDCLFLGIGGSALGPIALLNSLNEARKTDLKFHFMENPDPVDFKGTLKGLRPDSTLVCAVTKSGTTFETMAQLLVALDWLGRERWKSHLVAITDPAKGDLKAFATREGIRTLHIDPSMGGRFSVFTPVGLFPAALAGLSCANFLLGAKQVKDYVEKAPIEKNPLFLIGQELIRQFPKRTVHVCMPYSTRLKLVGSWFVQLWGESLGKDLKGFTPLGAVGATDQHSILQLLRDGPDDKVTFFLTVDEVEDQVKIPIGPIPQGLRNYPAFKILEGHSLKGLLGIEYRAIALVLTKRNRPHLTLALDRLDERTLGALLFSFSVLTAATGALWGVNPFDQPGVEEGKIYIREALSQKQATEEENIAVSRLRRQDES